MNNLFIDVDAGVCAHAPHASSRPPKLVENWASWQEGEGGKEGGRAGEKEGGREEGDRGGQAKGGRRVAK